MLSLVSVAELEAFLFKGGTTTADVAARLPLALSFAGSLVERQSGRKLARRRHRARVGVSGCAVTESAGAVTWGSATDASVDDVVSGADLPWGAQVVAVTDSTHATLDLKPAADLSAVRLWIGGDSLVAHADGSSCVAVEMAGIEVVHAVAMNGVPFECEPVVLDHGSCLVDLGVRVARGSLVRLDATAGAPSGSEDWQIGRMATMRIAEIVIARYLDSAGDAESESIADASLNRSFALPADVRDMIAQIRALA